MSEFKVGDKFEIVKTIYFGEEWEVGSIVELDSVEGSSPNSLNFSAGEGADRYCLSFGIEGKHRYPSIVRPLKTEAEKRGAKFGVGGVVNNTSAVKRAIGKKISFVGISKSLVVEESWMCAIEGEDKLTGFLPSSIRLDHEPEYREIPFSEATHEQRMDVGNLIHSGDAIVKEIYCFQNGGYAYTTSWAKTPSTALFRLTVRIPA